VKLMVPDWTGSLNVTATAVPVGTPVAPDAGDFTVTDGGVVSVTVVLNTTSAQ
jgi:hypothetical protein